MFKNKLAAIAAPFIMLVSTATLAVSDQDIDALRTEIQSMKKAYESRITELEQKLANMQKDQAQAVALAPKTPATVWRDVKDNSFNPSIGIVLNGQYSHFSSKEGEIAGFAIAHEGERPREGFAVDHTELNFMANVDDKFLGSVTAAIAEHENETEVELEEAYIQTLAGAGLPDGMTIKAGRAFWTLGYLNEHHNHIDDFADRPLPYRVFLNETYNDDGLEIAYLLPTDFYTEIGGGIFRGDDFPFGESDGSGADAWSLFTRIGGDIGYKQSWRAGAYILSGEAEGERLSNEKTVSFTGDTDLYIADLRYIWTPTGNARDKEIILQGEYFRRSEDGAYQDTAAETGAVNIDDATHGWYSQAIYRFNQNWRIGARYSRLEALSIPSALIGSALDSSGHDPKAYSAMLDWTNSEFSRIRLQYNREQLARGQNDNQIILQYIMNLGAHGAHKY